MGFWLRFRIMSRWYRRIFSDDDDPEPAAPAAADPLWCGWWCWLGTLDPRMGGVGTGAGGSARGPPSEEPRPGVHDRVDGREGSGYCPDG